MGTPFIIAIDEGTTNAKAIAVDNQGQILEKSTVPLRLSHPKPAWAQQDPMEIWQAVETAVENCLVSLGSNARDKQNIQGIAISNQRESVLVWDRKTGNPLTPLISWQCRRTESLCQQIAQQPTAAKLKSLTGSVLDPLFPASKIKWLLNSLENGYQRAENGELCVGTVDVWLVWKLTHGRAFVTDYSNASRYQLFNLHTATWDDQLLALFGIPKPCLPEIKPSVGWRGETLNCRHLPNGIPILSQAGDSHAALYGHCGFNQGVVKATYGTGSSLMTTTPVIPEKYWGVGSTVAWFDNALVYALEGNITHTGSALAFATQLLGLGTVEKLSELAQSMEHNQGVYFVPALAGLGAPYWDTQSRGTLCGLTDATTPATIARAAMEAVAYQVADVFFAMEQTLGKRLDSLSVDGGPTKNKWLMQFQADLLQRPIIKNEIAEISALGVAFMAGKALGWWKDNQQLSHLARKIDVITPHKPSEQMRQNYENWKLAVKRARFQ
ncbi:glycerol kinase GlpK [Lonepinella koalarum]|uniref:FGGY family carbohydrate kinase n=1 Tax=Lonepinella koalarum TaxID=53417 RepID=UPI0011E410AD|nr:FGGY-family carbohydrate kinase [Lonepinella koalarum]TYG34813.1 glycerol kinase GlpK [Lonepinella koalarum]